MIRTIEGTIRHRLLVNYAADPEVVAPMLPPGLRPQLVRGLAVVGTCILRLNQLRPAGLPARVGTSSDAAAHRVAVEWDGPHGPEVGVYVLRRDTAQRLPALVGGRLFPGVHGRAHFTVDDLDGRLHLAYRTADGVEVDVRAEPASGWSSRLFADQAEASTFFEGGACGWSRDRRGCLEGIRMEAHPWAVEPVAVAVRSSFHDDERRFPPGSLQLDAALLMRDVHVTWHDVPALRTRVDRRGALT